MRKITEMTVHAFLDGETMQVGNTTATADGLFLHGNRIAECFEDDRGRGVLVSLAGWDTRTTRDRLNGLFLAMGLDGFNQGPLLRIWTSRGTTYVGDPRIPGDAIELGPRDVATVLCPRDANASNAGEPVLALHASFDVARSAGRVEVLR